MVTPLIEIIDRLVETGLSNDEACMLVAIAIQEHNMFMEELDKETES